MFPWGQAGGSSSTRLAWRRNSPPFKCFAHTDAHNDRADLDLQSVGCDPEPAIKHHHLIESDVVPVTIGERTQSIDLFGETTFMLGRKRWVATIP
jgi:hypothetical protein